MANATGTKGDAPVILHFLNLAALSLLSVLLLLATVERPWHLLFPVSVLALAALYWHLRGYPAIVASFFSLSLATTLWIIVCENIVAIDNAVGTQITRKLGLGLRLQSHASTSLHQRSRIVQACCDDPLSYHLKPGSQHRGAFDCLKAEDCDNVREMTVDETGHLNARLGLMQNSPKIDLFLAGDSVTQGVGVPSVLEFVREQLPITMWNLSLAGYGPRQKVNALITYSLPKQPKWLVVEFYSGNDIIDAIRDDVCETAGDLRCLFSRGDVLQRLAAHPIYGDMLFKPPDSIDWLNSYAQHNLTLAMTKYVMINLKSTTREILASFITRPQSLESRKGKEPGIPTDISRPASARVDIRAARRLDWVRSGMALTHASYERLATTLTRAPSKPVVILLYNPSAYEIYRDIVVDRESAHDEASAFQIATLKAFAQKNDWVFLDLTDPLRESVQPHKTWIFGRYDGVHWSPTGTAIVAEVLSAELLKIIKTASTHTKPRQ